MHFLPDFPGSAQQGAALPEQGVERRHEQYEPHLSWMALEPDAWALYGFGSKTDWTNVIGSLNATFARSLQVTYLPGRTITDAKDSAGENKAGNDLYIKFSDVQVDYDHEHLILSIHFIDPKSNAELAMIPVRPYYGDGHNVAEYLKAALDEVRYEAASGGHGRGTGEKEEVVFALDLARSACSAPREILRYA